METNKKSAFGATKAFQNFVLFLMKLLWKINLKNKKNLGAIFIHKEVVLACFILNGTRGDIQIYSFRLTPYIKVW